MMVEDQPIKAVNPDGRRRSAADLRRRVMGCVCVAPLVAFMALLGGFLWFALHIANKEAPLDRVADGIVALTGGPSRITDAVELLASGRGRRLLITGVGPTTNTAEPVRLAPDYEPWFSCCVDRHYPALHTPWNPAQTKPRGAGRGVRC